MVNPYPSAKKMAEITVHMIVRTRVTERIFSRWVVVDAGLKQHSAELAVIASAEASDNCRDHAPKIAKVDPADEQPGSDHGGDDNGISEHIIFTPKGSLYQISRTPRT